MNIPSDLTPGSADIRQLQRSDDERKLDNAVLPTSLPTPPLPTPPLPSGSSGPGNDGKYDSQSPSGPVGNLDGLAKIQGGVGAFSGGVTADTINQQDNRGSSFKMQYSGKVEIKELKAQTLAARGLHPEEKQETIKAVIKGTHVPRSVLWATTMAAHASAVVYISRLHADGATGFLTRGNVIVTTHKVIEDSETAKTASITFELRHPFGQTYHCFDIVPNLQTSIPAHSFGHRPILMCACARLSRLSTTPSSNFRLQSSFQSQIKLSFLPCALTPFSTDIFALSLSISDLSK